MKRYISETVKLQSPFEVILDYHGKLSQDNVIDWLNISCSYKHAFNISHILVYKCLNKWCKHFFNSSMKNQESVAKDHSYSKQLTAQNNFFVNIAKNKETFLF